ncbi:hypothetical protein [Epilithonimonas sp. UC225_85]|uniref:hypothetical protein n=1 Tax=Epilithonimonas sp. UC225_85 TaxID=3350167 RepID=UPI0036D37E2B
MKNIIYYFSILFGVFTLASCDPSQDNNGDFLIGVDYNPNTNTGGTGGSTSRQLKQMISHLKDEDTGQFEDSNIVYSYSGTKLISYKDDSGETTKIDYNSSNKISKVSNSGQTSVFEYSGANVSKVVTTFAGVAKITSTYTFNGGKLVKVAAIQEFSIPVPIKSYLETSYQYQGENMTKSVIKNGIYDPVTGELVMMPEEQSIAFTYDTKKSPYKLLPTEYILLLAGIGPQGGAYLSANNFEKITISNTGASGEVMSFTHTYDSENYPIKSTTGDEYISYKYQ